MKAKKCLPIIPQYVSIFLILCGYTGFAQLKDQTWNKTQFPNGGRETQFMKVIDKKLYVVCNDGIWSSESGTERWSNILPGGIVSTFIKHKNNYYIGLWTGGIYKSTDMRTWSEPDSLLRAAVYKIVPDGDDVYVCTGKGLYKWNGVKLKWEMEKINNDNIHSQRITDLGVTNKKLVAFACDQLFSRDKGSTGKWEKMEFKYNFCVSDVLEVSNKLYFSTTGDGIYTINPESKNAQKKADNKNPHVQKIKLINNKIVDLYHKGIYEDGFPEFRVGDDYVTDIIEHENKIYISSAKEGIYTIPVTQARNKELTVLTVRPNPSSGQISYCIKNPMGSEYEINIVDISGRLILNKRVTPSEHEDFCDETIISVPGEYILRCNSVKENTIFLSNFSIVR